MGSVVTLCAHLLSCWEIKVAGQRTEDPLPTLRAVVRRVARLMSEESCVPGKGHSLPLDRNAADPL